MQAARQAIVPAPSHWSLVLPTRHPRIPTSPHRISFISLFPTRQVSLGLLQMSLSIFRSFQQPRSPVCFLHIICQTALYQLCFLPSHSCVSFLHVFHILRTFRISCLTFLLSFHRFHVSFPMFVTHSFQNYISNAMLRFHISDVAATSQILFPHQMSSSSDASSTNSSFCHPPPRFAPTPYKYSNIWSSHLFVMSPVSLPCFPAS